ncbi:MAG: hypothetical protein JXQ99_00070 [Hyphomicrobiaceae bacterium]
MNKQLVLAAVAGFAFAIGTVGVPTNHAGIFATHEAQAWNPVKSVKKAAKKVGGAVKKGAKAVGGAAKKVGKTAGRGAKAVAKGAGKVAKGAAVVGCRAANPTARAGACKKAVNNAIRAGKNVGRAAANAAKRAGKGAVGAAKAVGRKAVNGAKTVGRAAKQAGKLGARKIARGARIVKKVGKAILEDRVRVGLPSSRNGVRRVRRGRPTRQTARRVPPRRKPARAVPPPRRPVQKPRPITSHDVKPSKPFCNSKFRNCSGRHHGKRRPIARDKSVWGRPVGLRKNRRGVRRSDRRRNVTRHVRGRFAKQLRRNDRRRNDRGTSRRNIRR